MSDQQTNSMETSASLQFYSIAEVALIIDVSKKMVQKWVQEGHLPAFRVSPQFRLMRIRRQDLEDFIDKHTQTQPPKFDPE
jgi:excisionase family DNA binding protein